MNREVPAYCEFSTVLVWRPKHVFITRGAAFGVSYPSLPPPSNHDDSFGKSKRIVCRRATNFSASIKYFILTMTRWSCIYHTRMVTDRSSETWKSVGRKPVVSHSWWYTVKAVEFQSRSRRRYPTVRFTTLEDRILVFTSSISPKAIVLMAVWNQFFPKSDSCWLSHLVSSILIAFHYVFIKSN